MNNNRSHFLNSLTKHIASALSEAGVKEQVATTLAQQQVERFSEIWSGQLIYIPKNLKQEVREKHAKILAEFTGTNLEELATKYKVHPRTIYKILNKNIDDKI